MLIQGAIVWLLVYSNFEQPYISRLNSDSRVFGLYEKLFKSRIQPLLGTGIWCSHHFRNFDHNTKCTNYMA